MKDLVTAVYFKDCYAGSTILRLVDVFFDSDKIPEKYHTYEYEIKPMWLFPYDANED